MILHIIFFNRLGSTYGGLKYMIQRTVIVAKIQPGSDEQVAKIFAQSDSSDLPRLAGVRHRSLFVLDDVYVHLIESRKVI